MHKPGHPSGISHMRILLFSALVSLGVLLTVIPGSARVVPGNSQERSSTSLKFVQWSDIHLYHQDTSEQDFISSLKEGLADKPKLVALTGDCVDNKCAADEFTQRTKKFVDQYLTKLRDSHLPLCLSFGNNDFAKNYSTEPSVQQPVFAAYKSCLGDGYYLDELGNGVYPKMVAGLTWITINSLVFSPDNPYNGKGVQARRTLEWLAYQLKQLPRGRSVVVLSHVPPTMDIYSNTLAWEAPFIEQYQNIIQDAPGPLVTISGHFHRNEQHVFALAGQRVSPVLDAGGLSGKYGYLPNYRMHTWRVQQGRPVSFTWQTRYPGRSKLNSTTAIVNPFTMPVWDQFLARLVSDKAFFQNYVAEFWAHAKELDHEVNMPGTEHNIVQEFVVEAY